MGADAGPEAARRRLPSLRSLARLAPLLLAGALPAALLGVAIALFTLNHFFAHAPYLLDAGWYSDIVYRAGVFPRNPEIACNYADYYFGVHFSPLITVASLLSYLVPLHRIEWYAVFEALMFVPFGIATYLLASRLSPGSALRRLPVTVLAAFAFTFSGQLLKMIPYPHYEVAIAALVCPMLATLATGRMRAAWVFLVLALAVREDAGVHCAAALAPLLYLQWRGAAIPASRRALIAMIAVALASTVAGIFCQKVLFHGASIMSAVYLGDPIYSHLSAEVIAARARAFLDVCQVMYWPFLATCLLAAVRRDAGYLLGWAANLPWFALNFLASQPQKATFEAYAGFPFVVSIFWVYVYGATLAAPGRRLRPVVIEAVFAGICLMSTAGLYRVWPSELRTLWHDSVRPRPMDRAAVHGFVAALGEHRADLGRLYVDYSAAAIALESVGPENGWAPGVTPADAIVFHEETVLRDLILADLHANGLDVCSRIAKTGIFVCTRERPPAEWLGGRVTQVIPASFVFANSLKRPGIRIEPRGVTLEDGVGFDAYLGQLPKGTYELTWTLETDGPASAGGDPLVTVAVMTGAQPVNEATAPSGARTLSLRFEANGTEVLWFRSGRPETLTSSPPRTLAITQARVRRVP